MAVVLGAAEGYVLLDALTVVVDTAVVDVKVVVLVVVAVLVLILAVAQGGNMLV